MAKSINDNSIGVVPVELNKKVPGLFNVFVNRLGDVFTQESSGVFTPVKTFESKTSKGTYLVCTVLNPKLKNVFQSVSRMVCRTFHGKPPKGKNVVNHKDGDKHNNSSENLEWRSQSENTIHALESGLRKDNIQIYVTDLVLNTTTEYRSINYAAQCLESTRYEIMLNLSRHCDIPWKERYLFSFNKGNVGAVARRSVGGLVGYDHLNRNLIFTDSANELSILSGVPSSTIRKRAHGKDNSMIGGWSFSFACELKEWPQHSVEEIQTNRSEYLNAPKRLEKEPFLIKNYLTGEVKLYDSTSKCGEEFGIKSKTIYELIKDRPLQLHKGIAVQYVKDQKEWIDYDPFLVECSLTGKISNGKPIAVTDTLLNTTKRYASASAFAKDIGKYNKDGILSLMESSKRQNKLFAKRYDWKFIASQ